MSLALTPGQEAFAARLAQDSGLDPDVIAAWEYNEDNGSAAQQKESDHNYNWLNVGYTDSGQIGTKDPAWYQSPETAADATFGWISDKWQPTDPSTGTFGHASSGIHDILQYAGAPAQAQIHAIQSSGWASGGEASMDALYSQEAGTTLTPSGGGSPKKSGGGFLGGFVKGAEGAVTNIPGIGPIIGAGEAAAKSLNVPDPFTIAGNAISSAASGALAPIAAPFEAIYNFLLAVYGKLSSEHFWIDVALVIGGVGLIFIGVKTVIGPIPV